MSPDTAEYSQIVTEVIDQDAPVNSLETTDDFNMTSIEEDPLLGGAKQGLFSQRRRGNLHVTTQRQLSTSADVGECGQQAILQVPALPEGPGEEVVPASGDVGHFVSGYDSDSIGELPAYGDDANEDSEGEAIDGDDARSLSSRGARSILGLDSDYQPIDGYDSEGEAVDSDDARSLSSRGARSILGLEDNDSEGDDAAADGDDAISWWRTSAAIAAPPVRVLWADLADTESEYDTDWEEVHSRDWTRVATESHLRAEGPAGSKARRQRRTRRRRERQASLDHAAS